MPCAAGQYADAEGSTSCSDCAAGSVNAWVNSVAYHDWTPAVLGYFQVKAFCRSVKVLLPSSDRTFARVIYAAVKVLLPSSDRIFSRVMLL